MESDVPLSPNPKLSIDNAMQCSILSAAAGRQKAGAVSTIHKFMLLHETDGWSTDLITDLASIRRRPHHAPNLPDVS